MGTHSPKPWTASETSKQGAYVEFVVRDASGAIIVERAYEDPDFQAEFIEETRADFKLIAAAPDLYDALKALLSVFAEPPGQLDYTARADDAIQRATAALSRASGGADRG